MVLAGALALAGMVASAGEEQTEPAAVEVDADVPVLSAYVWRGQVLNDEAVFQPALNLTKGGFGLNVWGNFNLTDRVTDDADFSEIDLTISYGGKRGSVGWGVGLIEYLFPNSTLTTDAGGAGYPSTREAYASVSLPDLVVVPTLSVYRDIDEGNGTYASFGLGYDRALTDKLTLNVSAALGMADADYNAFYFGIEDAALNDANLGASVSYSVSKNLTITPSVQYTWLPDGDIKDAAGALYYGKDQVVGGLNINYVF
jgi:hypothetical protein